MGWPSGAEPIHRHSPALLPPWDGVGRGGGGARGGHSLSLSPGDGADGAVGQEVRAVADLHVGDTFLRFCLHQLVRDPPHRLAVPPAGIAMGPVTCRHQEGTRRDATKRRQAGSGHLRDGGHVVIKFL